MKQKQNFGACTYVLIIVFTFALKMPSLNCDLKVHNYTQGLLTAQLVGAVRSNWNRVISPALVQDSLLIAILGSKSGSQTHTELKRVGQISGSSFNVAQTMHSFYFKSDANNYLYVNNRLKITDNLKDWTRLATVTKYVNLTQVDEVMAEINGIVASKTDHLLQKDTPVLKKDDLKDNTAMISINAIRLSVKWLEPFERHVNAPNKTKDLMQIRRVFLYGELDELNATAIVLPVKDCKVYMLFIFANEEDRLMPLERRVQSVDITKIRSMLSYADVDLVLRRFKFETVFSLNTRTLKKLNISAATSENAEFDNFFKGKNRTMLKSYRQFSTINIDENGIQFASAITARYELIPTIRSRLPESVDEDEENVIYAEELEGVNPFFFYLIKGDNVLAAGSSYNGK